MTKGHKEILGKRGSEIECKVVRKVDQQYRREAASLCAGASNLYGILGKPIECSKPIHETHLF